MSMSSRVALTCVLATGVGFFLVLAKFCGLSEELVRVAEVAGPAISIGGYLAPAQTVFRRTQSGDPPLPMPVFASQLALCIVSIAYGLQLGNIPIVLTNSTGARLQVVWLSGCLLARTRSAVMAVIAGCGGLGVSVAGSLILTRFFPETVLGVLSLLLSFVFCLSPLSQVRLIVQSRNCSSIPLAMSGTMFLGNLVWGMYGYLLAINVVLIPCLLGLQVSLLLVLLNLWCSGHVTIVDFAQLLSKAPLDERTGLVTGQ